TPLVFVVTLRRYGFRRLLLALAASLALSAAIYIPIFTQSGFGSTLRPYLQSIGAFNVLTMYAPNMWMLLAATNPMAQDTTAAVGNLSYRVLGGITFGVYALLILWTAWNQADQRREFVWAGALYFGFFMLLTEMHERYLYPAAILSLVAVSQD